MARKKKPEDTPNGVAAAPAAVPESPPAEPPEARTGGNGEADRPAQSFRLPAGNGGYIEAALWARVIKIEDKDVTVYSVTVRKSWKDGTTGEWKNSEFFRTSELFLVRYLLGRAEEWILSLRVEADIPF